MPQNINTRWKIFSVIVISSLVLINVNYVKAISYGGIGGRPAYPRADNPRTDDIFVHTLSPGTEQAEGILVVNNSDETRTMMVYSADSTPSTEGGFACKQLAEEKKEVGAWITFGKLQDTTSVIADVTEDSDHDGLTNEQEKQYNTDPNNPDTDGDGVMDKQEIESNNDPLQPVVVALEPHTNFLIPFTISVPGDAEVGEHDGCVLIQEKKEKDSGQTGIVLSTRTGLRVAVTIPGDIVRQLEIVGFSIISRPQGGKILHPVVKNTGNVSIDAVVRVVTENIFGQVVAEHGGEYAILRGDTAEWNFELEPSFWGGNYKSYLTVEYDSDPGAGTGMASGQPKTLISNPAVSFWLVPQALALIIYGSGIVLIFVIIIVLMLARKRRKWIAKTWINYQVKSGDSVKILAGQYKVSWRLLAKANKLKPPYELTPDKKIKVPPFQVKK